jgi:putative DNA primase/helicase
MNSPRLDDAHIGPFVAERYLASEFLYSGAFGWMCYDGRRWATTDDAIVAEVIRRGVIDLFITEQRDGAGPDRLRAIAGLFSVHRMSAIQRVARGYLAHKGNEFDAHPHLLNVGNGVVDLRNGSRRPHDPKLLFTKVTNTDYDPAATHSDWVTALTAVSAEEADWLQVRFGQGLTGHPPSDDILLVFKGSGENGKSTIIDDVNGAASADYAIPLPDRVLLATTGQHPTELMELRDARIAYMEEFPEIGHLNVKRLKALTGTQWISARLCGKDTVKWKGTHSVFVTSNYLPRIDESDHGTWRRLLLLEFPHRYRKADEPIETPLDKRGDPGLRDRVRLGEDGQHEAVLAWMVAGAVRWYQGGRRMPVVPDSVRATTDVWRRSSDVMLRFIDDHLVFDKSTHVMRAELYTEFAAWLKANGHKQWSDQSFVARFEQHPDVVANAVQKKTLRLNANDWPSRPQLPPWSGTPAIPPNRYRAWIGVKFRDPSDPLGNQP